MMTDGHRDALSPIKGGKIVAYRVTVRDCRASDPSEIQPPPPWDTLIGRAPPLIYLLTVTNHIIQQALNLAYTETILSLSQ